MIQSYVDILLILIVAYNVLRGWQSGFIISLWDLLSWIGSLLAAFRFYRVVAPRGWPRWPRCRRGWPPRSPLR